MRKLEGDVCVVGSGVAGAIIARRCLESGLRVTMVEAGSAVNGRALPLRMLERTVRDFRIPRMTVWHRRARYQADEYVSQGNYDYRLRSKALMVRGGSTLGWVGFAFRHMPEDFRLHSSTGIGLDWPIDYPDLEPYYTLAEQSLRVAGDDRDGGHPPRSAPFPVEAIPFHRRDQPFLGVLEESGWSTMHNNVSLARDGGAFTADTLIDELETFADFQLLTRTAALRIVGSSPEIATGVECRNLVDGSSIEIQARAIVVAAGGIESPNLLQMSTGRWWPEGLGNHSGQLGQNLINHLGYGVGGRPRGIRLKSGPVPTTAVTRHFDSPDEQSRGKYILRWVPAPSGLLFLVAKLEQFPTAENRVSAGSARTRFGTPTPTISFSADDALRRRIAEVSESLELLATRMGMSVARRVAYSSAHPMGPTRMTKHDRDGVVDPSLRVHSTDNVFVCATSCFPTGGRPTPL